MAESETTANPKVREPADDAIAEVLPVLGIPSVPHASTLWYRALLVATGLTVLFLLDRLAYVLLDLWLLESLGYEEVFWTNFRTAAWLYVIGFAGIAFGIARPTFTLKIDASWSRLIRVSGVLVGLLGGYFLASEYLDFLMLFDGESFNEKDPIFNNDLGFYMFSLPAIWTIWMAVFVPMLFGLAACIVCAVLSYRGQPDSRMGRLSAALGIATTPGTVITMGIIGVLAAVGVWLGRYDLLWKDNYESSIFGGPEYIDYVGFFSYLNYYYVTAFVILGVTGVVVYLLYRLHQVVRGALSYDDWRPTLRVPALTAAVLIGVDFGFAGLIGLRDAIWVGPNEPVIQLPHIQRHVDATNKGYGLSNVEIVNFVPNDRDDPLPDPAELLATATLKNVPLWPGWVSYLERVLDPQHADRVLQTGGDIQIYGPVIDILRQQQKLRTYYDFIDVDTVRYRIDGETRMFATATRELPLQDPQPWLSAWGQRYMLFTHGYGLVMAPVNEIDDQGEPVYWSKGIPPDARHPELVPGDHRIYYGESSWTTAFSGGKGIKELDYPTPEGRAEVDDSELPSGAGVPVDSFLKRLVLGWTSGVFFDVVFTDMIGPETRAHYHRTPIERAERVAPFLYFDTNMFAVAARDAIVWMVNGVTISDRYPCSKITELGDKSNERAPFPRPDKWVNYTRDSVKIVVNALSGAVSFYKVNDEDPVLNTWARVYPDLFKPLDEMAPEVRAQLQYPSHLMHLQFDDIYKRYHMTDALTFFNMEDLWDDGDEVKGPILDEGKSISFSIEPYHWIAETDGETVLPASSSGTQFVMTMIFTNEKALNLRAIPMVYQDGDDYGRIVVAQVPKGHFYLSPEQADANIDQAPEISEQISWWNRVGAEVIHGHTSTLLIGKEVIYVAPLFIRSKQNTFSELKKVLVVFRGHAAEGDTLELALRRAIEMAHRARAES